MHKGTRRNVIALVGFVSLGLSVGVHAHLPHDPVMAMGVSPDFQNDQTLFTATFPELNWGNRDILRSTDGGETWTKLPNGMDNRFDFSAIRVSPGFSVDHAVFAATRGDGVYRSADQGNSWLQINAGLGNLNVKELRIGGSKNSDYALFAAPGSGGIYRRYSSQTAWSAVLGASVSVNALAPSPDFTQDSTVITADATGRLRISVDAGKTWTDRGHPGNTIIYDIAIAPGSSKEVFLATRNGIFYSSDFGRTFVKKGANLPAEAINNVAVSPNYLVDHTVACTSATRSVYVSNNSGDSWTLYPSGTAITHQTAALNEFSELQMSNTFSSDRTVFLSAFDGLFRSNTAGTTWSQIQTRANLTPGLALSPSFASDRSAIATNYYGGGISFTDDAGSSWSIRLNGWPGPGISNPSFDVDFVPNHAGAPMVVATKNFSYLGFSSDFGANWQMRKIPDMPDVAPGPVYPTVMGLSPAFDADKEIYLGTIDHGVIQSLDGGVTWRAKRGVPVLVKVTSVAVSPNYANDRTAFAGNMGQIWQTANGGDSWQRIGTSSIVSRGGLKYMWIAVSPGFATDHLVLVGSNNGIYRSTDSGSTWQAIGRSEIGASSVIQQIEFSPNFVEDRTLLVNVRGRGLYLVALDSAGSVSSLQNVGLTLLNSNVQFTEFRFSPTFKQDTTVMGASRGMVYLSTDGGLTWTLAGHPGIN